MASCEYMWLRMTQRLIRPLASGIHIDFTEKENIRLVVLFTLAPVDGHKKFMTIFNKSSESNEFYL